MRLIIDTNIMISSLLKDSITREILLLSGFEFFIPEYSLDEINNHRELILLKTGLNEESLDILLSAILTHIVIVTKMKIEKYLKLANEIIRNIDPTDIPFIALCLAISNDGIWSNDIHFDKQGKIKVWKTYELAKLAFGK